MSLRPAALFTSLTSLVLALTAVSASAAEPPGPPTADISVEASRSTPNDLFRAEVYAEATDASPGELARRVNLTVTQAIQIARAYPAVKVRSAGSATYPVYGKSGRTIDAWRMRSSLALESSDSAVLSELLGKLQQNMAVTGLNASPAPATLKKSTDEAIVEALGAFEARARLVAGTLGKKWKIRQISVHTGGIQPKPMIAYARTAPMMSADGGAPAPIEAGDSPVTVNVSGQIELLE